MDFVIIIPAKDEEKSIADTLNSVVNQTLQPTVCMVVDDGSEDKTPEIVKEFDDKYPNIRYHRNVKPKDGYSLGGHVVKVFNIGVSVLQEEGVQFKHAIKMDADITFENDTLEKLFSKINTVKLGIFSGTPYYMHNEKKILDLSPEWHAHGQFKVYNMQCLDEIGGIPLSLGWDTADNVKAMARGWRTCAYRDIFYKMHRKVGGKSSLKKGRINHGIGAYLLGYNYMYFKMRVLHDMLRPPVLMGAVYMFYGYWKSVFGPLKPILSKKESKILRNLLWDSMFARLKNKDFVVFQLINSNK